ncbi:MAG: chorismate synthase [Deltaproteobacteria bacterium]|nr:chorismate synthase [Deltaproteobacteria bacterium]
MTGNTFGTLFRVTSFGESHGPAVGVVIDGCPAGIALSVDDLQRELARRRPGQSEATSARNEPDLPEILSGLFEGKTTGMPIAVLVRNVDQRPAAYDALRAAPRPGHAAEGYLAKFGVHDHRGGGRAGGRETIARVIGGVAARKILPPAVRIVGHALAIGSIRAERYDPAEIEQNPVRCADARAAERMTLLLRRGRAEGNSLGGIVEVRVEEPPAGLGAPVFDKLKADLAKACMSIGAVMGFELGAGFSAAAMDGTTFVAHSEHFGGMSGGISTGAPLVCRLAVKPTSTVGPAAREGRHDPCIVPRLIPVAEAMTAIVLADHYLRQRALHG